MDAADLRNKVENAVRAKINAREAFTNVDISHPLIAQDSTVRHGDVKAVINDMQAAGEFRTADYRVVRVEVEPQSGTKATARLFCPSEINPATYQQTTQELHRTSTSSVSDPTDTNVVRQLPTPLS